MWYYINSLKKDQNSYQGHVNFLMASSNFKTFIEVISFSLIYIISLKGEIGKALLEKFFLNSMNTNTTNIAEDRFIIRIESIHKK